jgi:hypothetical protein
MLSLNGLRVAVYPNDHRPAHMHVIGNGCEAVFNLNCPGGPPKLRENYGFTQKDLTKISDGLAINLAWLCDKWSVIHGDY